MNTFPLLLLMFSFLVYDNGIIIFITFLSGHLLSTAEVESALVEHKAVAEAAVVGTPHPVKGESLYCFVTLNDGINYTASLEAELKKQGVCLCGLGVGLDFRRFLTLKNQFLSLRHRPGA